VVRQSIRVRDFVAEKERERETSPWERKGIERDE
jgi:hypothetical protein